ncbi:hypothetical protein [Dyella mobilis]|uniref:MSHA biogenesis protein MshK n=1 Tax=Dyella mobilis TaxID=1849582 RepID=A0ABS2KHL2_9GAMM|nr:hypothetical protein [Dyella mobilis]MBM7130657.1 hypothetical protein [Dyella mobilis]GLQ97281.1 hypothetical protein GCM10007863_17010 [Dyella mobilis]
MKESEVIRKHFGLRVMKLYGVFASVLLLFTVVARAGEAPGTSQWIPTAQQISAVEAQLVMPSGSKPLPVYTRYYYGQIVLGRHLLIGEFVLGKGRGFRIVSPNKAPQVLDGGCSVVNLKYDIERKKAVAIFCNGMG